MTSPNCKVIEPSCEPIHEPEAHRCSLRAVLAADIAGIGNRSHANQNEAAVKAHNELLQTTVYQLMAHDGWLFAVRGYRLFALFDSAISSVRCALALQQHLHVREPCADMRPRVGVHMGEVHFENELPSGEILAIAGTLESLADPGGVMVSGLVMDIVSSHVTATFEPRDAPRLKETLSRVTAFAVAPPVERTDPEPTLVVDTPSDRSREPACETASTGGVYWMSSRTESTPVEPDLADQAPTAEAPVQQPEPAAAEPVEPSHPKPLSARFSGQHPSQDCLESLTGALAVHIGPISKLIVDQALKDASSLDQLIAIMEKHIPNIERRFLFRVRASHICATFAGDPF